MYRSTSPVDDSSNFNVFDYLPESSAYNDFDQLDAEFKFELNSETTIQEAIQNIPSPVVQPPAPQIFKPTYYAAKKTISIEEPSRVKRTRGRPRGNPPKLNLEQRRQRNAELERERRAELSDAYLDLQNSVNWTDSISEEAFADEMSRAQLLERAINLIKEGTSAVDNDLIRQQNENLLREIEMLESRMLD